MIVVTAGVIFKDGQILVTQRPPGTHGALKWEFPGGKLEEHEDPRLCLAREVREELDIDVRVDRILEVIFHRYPERSVLLLFFRCSWLAGEPKAIGCQSFAWTPPEKLTSFDFLEADLDFIRRIGEYL
jgi:8-oxo-dGTP diphosphatase